MTRDQVVEKFNRLTANFADDALRAEIISAVDGLEDIAVEDLTALLGRFSIPNDLDRQPLHMGGTKNAG
jgi:2-methylcitrate dehydratase